MKQNHNILVVDDEQAHTIALCDLLKKAGYQVAAANDGFKALAACKVRTPDVIILDLHMPMMGGLEVFNRLRSDEKTNHIPIIFLGNKDQTLQNLKGTEVEEVLFKPFEPQELLARVKHILREKELKDELKRKEVQLSELALEDPLTSLKSARYLSEFLKTNIKQSKRYNTPENRVPLSVVVVEVDQHKELLKAVGQKAADSLVTQLSAIIAHQLRDSDITARTGHFEFTVILTVTDCNGAIEVAERLRNVISESTFAAGDMELNITVSLGICEYNHQMDDDGKVLLSHARAALQQGHNSGGNVTLMAQ